MTGSASHNTVVLIEGILTGWEVCLDMVWFCGNTEPDCITDYAVMPHVCLFMPAMHASS